MKNKHYTDRREWKLACTIGAMVHNCYPSPSFTHPLTRYLHYEATELPISIVHAFTDSQPRPWFAQAWHHAHHSEGLVFLSLLTGQMHHHNAESLTRKITLLKLYLRNALNT